MTLFKFSVLLTVLACTQALAQPNNSGGGVTSDAIESLNRHIAAVKAGPAKAREPASGITTVKIVKVLSTTATKEGKGQTCDGLKVSPSPVVVSYTRVGFDEAGNARLTDSMLEIKDCGGTTGPDATNYINEARQSISQDQLTDLQRFQLGRMFGLAERSPDCSVTLKVNAEGKIVDMQGCKDNSP